MGGHMNTQSEYILEEELIKQLSTLGYERVTLKTQEDLYANLKQQLEKHNHDKLKGTPLSEGEFNKILNWLDKGTVFERAKTLREKCRIKRDDDSDLYIEFINKHEWCQNQYQVTSQVTQEGSYKNRYDVTLLINGLPLVQIELKRRGIELKEAFNQINRYQRHSFWANSGLFQYVQLFVISNGVNTKYYANNRKQSFKHTFFWTDENNNHITQLSQFAEAFLEKCQVSKMICKYIVLHESDKALMVLRPYQYYAVEKLIDKVKTSRDNGYIWHTTGSGKTLTSFKAAQILTSFPKVHKVVFCVDRADLDYQTQKEFNSFSEGSVDGTTNTNKLVKQFTDPNTKLIVTTIQKLNTAIHKQKHLSKMETLKDKRVVFIFDECHRSQFGDTHKRIKNFFNRAQMFGFTGTPIFAENANRNEHGKRTTADLFCEHAPEKERKALHKYVITNAIKDENVLKFSVEYVRTFKKSDGTYVEDEQVESINTKEVYNAPERIEKVVNWIIQNHDRKTHNKKYTAMFCVSSVESLIQYYEAFQQKKKEGLHDLRIATIFTYGVNEEDKDANGLIEEVDFNVIDSQKINAHSRDKLQSYILDYNKMYGTKFSTKDSQSFYNYYKDIAKRIKDREKETAQDSDRVDILLVVNMFLTGFDAKKVNTLYVDKNLKHHGLIQAFSRTNRILNEVKSQGNIVCFRNLKGNTDKAISLFSNTHANEIIIMEPYEEYLQKFNEGVKALKAIAPTVDSVNDLKDEKEEFEFVKSFRSLIRLMNVLKGFSEFKFDDVYITPQEFEDYKSKYLDIHDKTKKAEKESTSIINEIDFELELIQRDEINVSYILKLLAELYTLDTKNKQEDSQQKRKAISDLLNSDAKLRSKKELIERFIQENLFTVKSVDDIEEAFDKYWSNEKVKYLESLCKEEDMQITKLSNMIESYIFTGKEPLWNDILKSLNFKPKMLEKESIVERIKNKVKTFIETFEDEMGG